MWRVWLAAVVCIAVGGIGVVYLMQSTATVTLAGRVVGPGQPADGYVWVVQYTTSSNNSYSQGLNLDNRYRIDSQGHFVLEGLNPDYLYDLVVRVPGYSSEYVQRVDPMSALTVNLSRGYTVRGTIVNSTSGLSNTGLQMTAICGDYRDDPRQPAFGVDRYNRRFDVTFDENGVGSFTIHDIACEKLMLEIWGQRVIFSVDKDINDLVWDISTNSWSSASVAEWWREIHVDVVAKGSGGAGHQGGQQSSSSHLANVRPATLKFSAWHPTYGRYMEGVPLGAGAAQIHILVGSDLTLYTEGMPLRVKGDTGDGAETITIDRSKDILYLEALQP